MAVYNDDVIRGATTQIHEYIYDDDDDDDDDGDDDDDDNNVQNYRVRTTLYYINMAMGVGGLNYYDYTICMLYVCGFV